MPSWHSTRGVGVEVNCFAVAILQPQPCARMQRFREATLASSRTLRCAVANAADRRIPRSLCGRTGSVLACAHLRPNTPCASILNKSSFTLCDMLAFLAPAPLDPPSVKSHSLQPQTSQTPTLNPKTQSQTLKPEPRSLKWAPFRKHH